MLGVVLARLAGMVGGMSGMTVRRMSVVRSFLMGVRVVVLGRFAMVLGGVLMVLGRGVVMLDDLVFGHCALHPLCSGCGSVVAAQL
jgi:hypothetical protein